MSAIDRIKQIAVELKSHAPFTLLGAFLGIVFMLIFKSISYTGTHILFEIFHPAHVLLSAMVTASMFKLHSIKKHILLVLIIGYVGSIGVATVSDIIIPHIGASVLGLNVPPHSQIHENEDVDIHQEKPLFGIHLGFIEDWYIVNPAALIGIAIAFFLPRTKFPHSMHVLISTWASSSYLLMSAQKDFSIASATGIFVTLFIAVWLPCCISDIVFPLLFVKSGIKIQSGCAMHSHHSCAHTIKKDEQ